VAAACRRDSVVAVAAQVMGVSGCRIALVLLVGGRDQRGVGSVFRRPRRSVFDSRHDGRLLAVRRKVDSRLDSSGPILARDVAAPVRLTTPWVGRGERPTLLARNRGEQLVVVRDDMTAGVLVDARESRDPEVDRTLVRVVPICDSKLRVRATGRAFDAVGHHFEWWVHGGIPRLSTSCSRRVRSSDVGPHCAHAHARRASNSHRKLRAGSFAVEPGVTTGPHPGNH